MTPIASVQNILAVSALEQIGYKVSFGAWLCVSLPMCSFLVFTAWLLICFVMKPDDVHHISVVVYERTSMLDPKNLAVMISSLIVILLFATSSFTGFFP